MKPLVKNASDEEQVRAAKVKEKFGRDRELSDLRFVLGTLAGRRFIWRQLGLCDRISAHQSGSWTYFQEGERNAALKLKAEIIEADQEALFLMMKEAKGNADE